MFLFMFLFFLLLIGFKECFSSQTLGMQEFQYRYQEVILRGNSQELTEIRGFINENHTVETADGFLLSVFRIRKPSQQNIISGKPPYPFIILHGLFSDSESFQRASDGFYLKEVDQYVEFEDQFRSRLDVSCNFADDQSGKVRVGRILAYNLAACGYDVWLMNVRDSPQYARHRTWNKELDPEFWNTTLDSYTEDLRAVLSHVLTTSGSPTAALLCHSAGCSTAFQLMIEHPEANHQLLPLFLLAPYIYTGSIFSTLIATSFLEPILRDYLAPTWSFRRASEMVVETLSGNLMFQRIYGSLFSFLGGFSAEEFDWSRIQRIAAHIPGTAASRLVAHVGQRRDRDRFCKFDYGSREANFRAYGQIDVPEYDLARITNQNMILFTGLYDSIAPFPAMERLRRNLKVQFLAEIRTPNSHMDFIFGNNVNETVNFSVFHWLRRLNL